MNSVMEQIKPVLRASTVLINMYLENKIYIRT